MDEMLGGRYRLGQLIGTGGMASVYEAEDVRLNRRVAVKVLHPQYAVDAGFVARFERESSAIADLNHPAIVDVYDRGQDNGKYFIVMPFVEGQSVKQLVRQGPLSVDQTIDIGVQIAKGLEYAHQNGIVHRDVKSHNILVAPTGAAKLVDFGIAITEHSASLTDVGTVLGTVHYVAPEQARGQTATSAGDVYSLGVVLYEMATGRLPFEGDNAVDIATRHVTTPPMPPARLNPHIPAGLERAILHALEKDPARRPASAGHLAEELLRATDLDEQPTRAVQALPRSQASFAPRGGTARARTGVVPRTSETWPLVLLALAALMLVLGLIPLWSAVFRSGSL